ncbi:MAG: hypothetical protein K9W44_10075 [Candidatus Lokiarchaeota archaeon]|nr:hypothetical protein [Candidatus Harpocratesius repetitus]
MRKTIKISTVLLVLLMASYFSPIYTRALDDSDYEPNNDLENAALITTGEHTGLTLSSTTDDDDWFKIELTEGMAISVEMEVTDSDNANYFYLQLYNENETYLDSESFSYYTDDNYENKGKVSYYADEFTLMIYIQCHNSFWNTNDATYTLRITIFDPKGETKFSYGIETGDDLIYTAINNIDLQASSKFYNEVGGYIVDEIESNEGQDVFSNSFNFSHFMGDLLDFISTEVDLKFSISDIYNLDLQKDNMSNDIIEGSFMMGNDDNWVLPSAYLAGKLEDLNSTFKPYFDPDFYDDVQSGLNESITELNEVEAEEFEDLLISIHTYLDNVTDAIDLSVDPLDDGTVFPALPDNHYLPIPLNGFLGYYSIFSLFSSVELCYPTDFSFLDWYNWGLDVYNFSAQYAEQEGEDISVFDHSIQDLFEIGGISSFHVDKQSIGFVWSSSGIDFDALQDLLNYTDGDLEEDLATQLVNQGIDYNNSAVSISFAIEYNSDMVLASFAQYIDLTIAFDNTSITEFDIDGETVTYSISQSIVREGYETPTAEQIQDGEIGENRDLDGGFFSNIPGAPVSMISFASLLSLFAIVYYIKRRK